MYKKYNIWKKSLLMIKYIVKIFVFNQLVRINLMEKQRIRCSEQNNYSNCSLPPGGVLPHTLCLRKELCNSDCFIIIKEHILPIYRPYCSHIIYIKYFFFTAENEIIYCDPFSLRYITSVSFTVKTSASL